MGLHSWTRLSDSAQSSTDKPRHIHGEKSTALVSVAISREVLRLGRSCWGSGREGVPGPPPAPRRLPLKRDPGVP